MVEDIEKSLLRNLLLKTRLVIVLFIVIFFIQVSGIFFINLILFKNIELLEVIYVPLFILFVIIDEFLLYRYLTKLISSNRYIQKKWIYLISIIEISYPTILLIYGSQAVVNNIEGLDLLAFTSSPPFLLYFVFIILSSLYFDFKLCVINSLVASVQFLLITFYLFDYSNDHISFIVSFSKGIFIFPFGILAGFIALTIKKSIQETISTKNLLINELDTLVKVRTKQIEIQKDEIILQNNQLEVQKNNLFIKNKEITDSIHYAKRIQAAILPPQKLVNDFLPNSFVLYKPKDIVAGDFYWMERVAPAGNKGYEIVYFAAADCTGHGVPGAMVSVICNNGLNRSVKEYGLTNTGKVLDKTREIVIQEFEKSEEEVKDGMDISVCAWNKTNNQLQWSGANNPLWIISDENRADLSGFKNQTGLEGRSLFEVKPNKQPIGKVDNPQPFTTHTIELQKGDTIYIFTDGYQDQFGGEKGKKFKASQLKEILLTIQDREMNEQKDILDEIFEKWRGTLEQVDDVCIIGVRV
jgi:serine phosphatase RsbU (regulator of sigma subunit)